jgi:hypothetical protein
MAGVDLWRAKLPKVAAEGGIGPPPPSLAASVAAPLEDNYTLRAAKVHSRSRDGSSVGDALTHFGKLLDMSSSAQTTYGPWLDFANKGKQKDAKLLSNQEPVVAVAPNTFAALGGINTNKVGGGVGLLQKLSAAELVLTRNPR